VLVCGLAARRKGLPCRPLLGIRRQRGDESVDELGSRRTAAHALAPPSRSISSESSPKIASVKHAARHGGGEERPRLHAGEKTGTKALHGAPAITLN